MLTLSFLSENFHLRIAVHYSMPKQFLLMAHIPFRARKISCYPL